MKISTFHVCRYIGIFVLALTLCVVSFTSIATAADSQRSGKHVQHKITSNPIKIGDVENHFIGTYQYEGVNIVDGGEVATSVNNGIFDFTNGLGTYSGYAIFTFSDGSTYTIKYEGAFKMTDKGKVNEGTTKFVGGTGRFEGVTGKGTFQSKAYNKGKMSIVDWKDSISLP